MNDEFSRRFFAWADAQRLRAPELAELLGKEVQTIYNWRNKGVPKSQRVACQYLIDRSQEERFEEVKSQLVLRPTADQLRAWNEAALSVGKTIEDWAFEGLEEMAEEFFSDPIPSNITPMVAEPSESYGGQKSPKAPKPYEIPFLGCAAAGEQVEAPLDDTISVEKPYPKGWFAVRVNGQSMEPTLPDGALIVCEPKEYTPGDGKVYVVSDGSGCSVKRFNRKRNAFVSDNPAFPDMLPVGDVKLRGIVVEVIE